MKQDRFSKCLPLTQGILAKIARLDQFKGLWQGSLRLSPQILGRLKSWVVITSAGSSTRIEGATMSDQEIARFLRGFKAKHPKSRDEQEVAGYADLIGRIFDNWQTIKLSENWILQLHDILLRFSARDQLHKGGYKKVSNTVVMTDGQGRQVVLFKPTPPYLVKSEMLQAIEWTNAQLVEGKIHPLLVIAGFIFEFLAIHPFLDGNGRLSRALTNLLLLRAGYSYVSYISLDEIIEETKVEYYLALREAQKRHKTSHEDVSPWVDYFLDALLEQAARAHKLMELEQPERLLSEKQATIYQLFQSGKELSVSDVGKLLKGSIVLATIKQALARLVKLKLLERSGQGRGVRYKRYIG